MPRRTAVLKTKVPRPSPKRDELVRVAEDLFDRYGFHATGVDRLIQESGVARMTMYKHFPTKNALVLAALARRDDRFWEMLEAETARRTEAGEDPVLCVFDALGAWLARDGAQGDLLLRALAEFANHDVTVAGDAVFRKKKLGDWFAGRLTAAGIAEAEVRAWDLALLFEGAAALAPVVGGEAAAGQARHAATALLRLWSLDMAAERAS